MFSFFSKDKPPSISKRTLQDINAVVHNFLKVRDVQNFKVYTIDYAHNPVVLIQAEPQKKLRFSNILEIQIKRHLKERLGFQVPAIFWRFKTDTSEVPGPEQADYEFEEAPEYPQDMGTELTTTEAPRSETPNEIIASGNEHYDVHQLARKGMQVEEITMGEFDEFLKGAARQDTPEVPRE